MHVCDPHTDKEREIAAVPVHACDFHNDKEQGCKHCPRGGQVTDLALLHADDARVLVTFLLLSLLLIDALKLHLWGDSAGHQCIRKTSGM